MGVTNLFLLLAETEPFYQQWMLSNEPVHDESLCNEYLDGLFGYIKEIEIENYDGYYDPANLDNFLLHYEIEIDYPHPRVIISEILKERWGNWRDTIQQALNKEYTLFSQPIENHTFCEISQRKLDDHENNYALLNHHACKISDIISVAIGGKKPEGFSNLRDKASLIQWFAENRIPKRIFKPHDKHKKQPIKDMALWGEGASILECSDEEAQVLLNTAIGDS